MDFVITFFRDILDGPLYVIVTFICGILFCSCIGYLGEVYLNKKKQGEAFNKTYASVTGNQANPQAVQDTYVNQGLNLVQNAQQINPNYTSSVPLSVSNSNQNIQSPVVNTVNSVNNNQEIL